MPVVKAAKAAVAKPPKSCYNLNPRSPAVSGIYPFSVSYSIAIRSRWIVVDVDKPESIGPEVFKTEVVTTAFVHVKDVGQKLHSGPTTFCSYEECLAGGA